MIEGSETVFEWPDVGVIRSQLGDLLDAPVYELSPAAVEKYMSWFDTHCRRSRELAEQARSVIPGGVQHSLAASVPYPLQFERAEGCELRDVDGNTYIDFVQAGGASVLGANDPVVRDRVVELLADCAPAISLAHPYEIQLARFICDAVPGVERFRMVGSGTEAAMAAVRAARVFTGATHIIKVGSAYHGWSDQLTYGLRLPGSGRQGAAGIPEAVHAHTHETPPDDLAALRALLTANAGNGGTAAIILEPLGPQSGTYAVDRDFNQHVRDLCTEFGALLVFDEVVTAFRLGLGGVQERLGVRPDLTVFGKCVSGGYPGAGGVGGSQEVMAALGPGAGPDKAQAFVAGTLSAGPLSAVAGYHTLREMERTGAPAAAARAGDRLRSGLAGLINKHGLPFVTYNFGSIVHLHTTGAFHLKLTDPDFSAQLARRRVLPTRLAVALAAEGLVVPVTGRMFTNAAMDERTIEDVLGRFDRVFSDIVSSI
ncbi:aminotransferase class III-fold pyridoxal phosphate-dependent enzyme [Streptomyces sp. NPDC001758]